MNVNYRPEIDGLRAIAVLSVFFYHLGITHVSSGFLGVDVFFVISGYLITKNIVSDYDLGSFTLYNFYERRIRRIIPLLFLVVLTGNVISYIFLTYEEIIESVNSSIYAEIFLSNFYFWKDGGYFSSDSNQKMFLHTWSLGIEEQYYITFPILLIFLLSNIKRYIWHTIIFIGLVSFLTAIYGSINHPNANFYLLPSRIWEFILGSSAALIHNKNFGNNLPNALQRIFGNLGLLMIIISMVSFDKTYLHPSLLTILPTLGATLIIINKQDCYASRVLSYRPMVSLGLISYGIYLWHYLIIVFANKFTFGSISLFSTLCIFVLTILVSYTSFYFVEKPLRSYRVSFKFVFMLILILFIGNLSFVYHVNGNDDEIAKNYNFTENLNFTKEWGFPYNLEPLKPYDDHVKIMDSEEDFTIVLFGDSHAQQYARSFIELGNQTNKNVLFYSKTGCSPFENTMNKSYRHCIDFVSGFKSFLSQHNSVKKIVISFCLSCHLYLNTHLNSRLLPVRADKVLEIDIDGKKHSLASELGYNYATDQFASWLIDLSETHDVTLFLDNPLDDRFKPTLNIIKQDLSGMRQRFFERSYGSLKDGKFSLNSDMKDAILEFEKRFIGSSVRLVNLFDKVCADSICSAIVNGRFIYRDNNHIRNWYSSKLLEKDLETIFR